MLGGAERHAAVAMDAIMSALERVHSMPSHEHAYACVHVHAYAHARMHTRICARTHARRRLLAVAFGRLRVHFTGADCIAAAIVERVCAFGGEVPSLRMR